MSTTARDLIDSTFRLLGITASGESPSSDEANDALTTLNQMIDSWSTQSLTIYNKVEDDLTLIGSQQSYQMGQGSGADFTTDRPIKVVNANLRTSTSPTTFDLPMEILNRDQWANITVKSVTSNIPTKIFVQYTYPNATLYLWPIPVAATTLVLWSWKALAEFSTLNSTIDLPPGYLKAIRYNLALELGPEFGREPSALVAEQAVMSLADIKRANQQPIYLSLDPALRPQQSVFNWLTGE